MAIAGFAFFVALVPLLFALTPGGGELRNATVIAVCVTGMMIAPLLILQGKQRHWQFREWIFQAVLLYSIAGPFICQIFLDELRPAILTLYMLGPIGAAYYAPRRRSLPLIATGVVAILYVSTRIDEPDAMLRGILVAVVTVGCAALLSAMKRHLVRSVQNNRELSERDALTGAYNLHKFDERLAEEIARSLRDRDGGFALIEFDLDHFKPVNDNYNHSVGDAVLVATVAAIQSALAPADLLVRRGGDEFAVIAPLTPGRNPVAMIEHARNRIVAARLDICPGLPPTASAGWVIHDHLETAESIMRRADDALHNSKRVTREREAAFGAMPDGRTTAALRTVPPTGEVIELRRVHAETIAIGNDPINGVMRIAWRMAGICTFLLSVVLAVMGVSGKTSFAFSPVVIALLAI